MIDEVKKIKKKAGRKPKNHKREYVLDKEQSKFFVDLSNEKDELDMIFSLLEKTNNKEFGREVTFKDLALFGLGKLTEKDLIKVQELTLSKREILERQVLEYNSKNGKDYSFEDYFIMKEGIKF